MQEDEIIEKAKHGDKEAFSEIVIMNQSQIYNLCLRMVKDEKMAEDLTQESFLKAYQKLGSFQKKSKISTWLYRIAYNHCINYLKKNHRLKEEEFKETIFFNSNKPETIDVNLDKVMKILPEKQWIVFELYYVKKMPQKQIAAILNVPLGTIRSRIHYAKKKIKQLYKDFNSLSKFK